MHEGTKMPLSRTSRLSLDIGDSYTPNQAAPLFLSSKGRYLWSSRPYTLTFNDGLISCEGGTQIILEEGHRNLKGAYLAASKKHFPFTGQIPDAQFFTVPQYNTWIELMHQQTQQGVISYAEGIRKSGLTPGILMIDCGWSKYFGSNEFDAATFPDPKAMVSLLHEWGFQVMVWVSPNVSPDSAVFRLLRDTDYLLRDKNGEFAVRKWWDGFSCVLDLTNPAAADWFESRLRKLQTDYGIDGFKIDAGDPYFYRADDQAFLPSISQEQTKAVCAFAERFPLNELRAAWSSGGRPLVMRLSDKLHSWDKDGLNTLLPNSLLQGLLGYSYHCPDMIGGGEYMYFKQVSASLDQELVVRYAQASALMPMMQFSAAPWRILDPEHFELVKNAAEIHYKHGSLILSLARHAAETGEPIVRPMAYEFPDQGFETVSNQFMLGDSLMVAPVLGKGQVGRKVKFPSGIWESDRGEHLQGGQSHIIDAPLSRLPYFKKCVEA